MKNKRINADTCVLVSNPKVDNDNQTLKTNFSKKNKEKQLTSCLCYNERISQKWGWIIVTASWIVMIPLSGVMASFGTIVSEITNEFNGTKFEAGWIGSLAYSFAIGTCPLSTPLFLTYGYRPVALIGVIGASVSLFVTSFSPIMHMFFFTYSFLYGVSTNFIYNSAMILSGQYFKVKHQALATCLASAGISFGTLLINPLSTTLIKNFGWRNTQRILSGIILVVGTACISVYLPENTRKCHQEKKIVDKSLTEGKINMNVNNKIDPEECKRLQQFVTEEQNNFPPQEKMAKINNKNVFDCSFCNNLSFLLWMVGTLLWSISFLFPFIFLIEHMVTLGISRSTGAWVLTGFGIAEFVGRLLSACGADKIKNHLSLAYVYAITSCSIGATTIFAAFGQSLVIMLVYAICAGISSGILNSLMYAATMQLFGQEKGNHVWGYINVMLATGLVVGPVVSGAIYDATNSYGTAFYMGGGVFFMAGILIAFIPLALRSEEKSVELKIDIRIDCFESESDNYVVKSNFAHRL